jgi:hypothetical protein
MYDSFDNTYQVTLINKPKKEKGFEFFLLLF